MSWVPLNDHSFPEIHRNFMAGHTECTVELGHRQQPAAFCVGSKPLRRLMALGSPTIRNKARQSDEKLATKVAHQPGFLILNCLPKKNHPGAAVKWPFEMRSTWNVQNGFCKTTSEESTTNKCFEMLWSLWAITVISLLTSMNGCCVSACFVMYF